MAVSVSAPGPDEKTTETALTKLGDALLRQRGWIVKETTTALNPKDGYPQRVYVKEGRMLFVEYLSAKGKPTKTQDEWRAQLEKVEGSAGGVIEMLVIRPNNWDELRQAAR